MLLGAFYLEYRAIKIGIFNKSSAVPLLNMPKYICALEKPFYT